MTTLIKKDTTSNLNIINNKKIAHLYSRVSTTLQEDNGVSLETQEKSMIKYCNYKDYEYKLYKEVASGKDIKNRPVLKEILENIKSGETLIVAELSRFSRSPVDSIGTLERFKKEGINFVSITPEIDFTSMTGELMFGILMVFYKHERQRIGENIKINMQRLTKENKLRGLPPFGYKNIGEDKDFEIVPEQQEVIKKIIEMYNEDKCYARVCKKLNEEGLNKVLLKNKPEDSKLKTVPKFYATTIKRILIDYGVVEDKNKERKPIKDRIISHHKKLEKDELSDSE